MAPTDDMAIDVIRAASRRLVRELGFMGQTLAGTGLSPSSVHALIAVGEGEAVTAAALCDLLRLEKSSVSRLVRKLVAAGLMTEGASGRDGRVKPLALTGRGRETLEAIHRFARSQVRRAMDVLPPAVRGTVAEGLNAYAAALRASRAGVPAVAAPGAEIVCGYQPGVIGRCVEMHARYYARTAGFGAVFESTVAAGMAAFTPRLDRAGNGLWVAVRQGQIIGTLAIDGEDLNQDGAQGGRVAHLRWFIVDDGARGGGTGRRLLSAAMAFCDAQGFAATRLWTFRGLDAARRLYEEAGFVLEREWRGGQWGTEVMEQCFSRPCPV
ncbi:DNA-binding MarR family transcriptional regulator/GNAT superfamily N-acetyltransferase [Azospirillum fermentarium]|uniref:helix-turn-helix domain-containing GNAT family N-acetyltransferase n=1 Tax=Azospirillum fermentarium TaxID=1233114 RepID=UPI0022270542|nr:helix-turn-helix domain-containing GNAT family N-acetyltransferase [Azospirillum fermentarium]MCW2247203.1 DNA-binding MarR family transcriptional regulator/GNAT superfamily N-acetyltransferase [Azospirillum fermentarium]